MLEGFGACKAGTQLLMQFAQAHRPVANFPEDLLGLLGCGRVGGLHADLLSERRHHARFDQTSSMSHPGEYSTKVFSVPSKIPGTFPGKRASLAVSFQDPF